MSDGAEWIWNLAEQHFPGAVQIVDLYHARQHLWDLARRLHRNDEVNQKAWMKLHQRRLLDHLKIEKLVEALRSLVSTSPDVVEKIRTETEYFQRDAARMRYPKFRRQHLFVGSGVIEASCKTAIGSRLKQSACAGLCVEPTPSLPSDAVTLAASLRATERRAGLPNLHFLGRIPPSCNGPRYSPPPLPNSSPVIPVEVFPLIPGSVVGNGTEPSRARSLLARRSGHLTARTVPRQSGKRGKTVPG